MDPLSTLAHASQLNAQTAEAALDGIAQAQKSEVADKTQLTAALDRLESFSREPANSLFGDSGISSMTISSFAHAHHPPKLFELAETNNARVSNFASANELLAAYKDPKLNVGDGLGGVLESIKDILNNSDQNLESQDKMGNFEIQDLMSEYNNAQNLAASVQKHYDDSSGDILKKI
jgi:hypothetical protein